MTNKALYVYGVVKLGIDLEWKEKGLNGKKVYMVSKGGFSALVHNRQEIPYNPKDPEKIKKLIIAHNKILDRAMEDFGGVIPLPFNTIIRRGKYNLKKWLDDDKERLERIWNGVKGKRECGIRIYYEKSKIIQEASNHKEIKRIRRNIERGNEGLQYLLQEKVKSKINETVQERINQFKQRFYDDISKITTGVKVNTPRIFIDEEKDLLLGLSVLVDGEQINKIKKVLEKNKEGIFSFHLAGPFAPYSFVENETK